MSTGRKKKCPLCKKYIIPAINRFCPTCERAQEPNCESEKRIDELLKPKITKAYIKAQYKLCFPRA